MMNSLIGAVKMTSFQKEIILLVKSAIDGVKVEISKDFDWDKAITIGKKHNILPLLYYGVINSEIELEPQLKTILENFAMQYLYVDIKQSHHIDLILNAFEHNNIDYMPLKGVLLKKLYPKPEMRYMGDADILIKECQYDKIIPILESLGFTEKKRTQHELVWVKDNVCIELHRRIFDPHVTDMCEYYGDGWKFAQKESSDSSKFLMSSEDNFVYLFSHFSKHFIGSGIGVNHIIDLYIFLKKNDKMNDKYITSQLEKLNLLKFYYNILKLIDVWFNGKKSNDTINIISDKIFCDGSYGSKENMDIINKANEISAKGNNIFYPIKKAAFLVFPKYSDMCDKYYMLKKYFFLLPFFWIWRIIGGVFKLPKFIIKTHNRNEYVTDEKLENHYSIMKKVGLDNNFKE